MANGTQLNRQQFIRTLSQTYNAIARKIEELINLMNEGGENQNKEIKERAKQIIAFLDVFKRSCEAEIEVVKRAIARDEIFLHFLKEIRDTVRDLKVLLKVVEKGNVSERESLKLIRDLDKNYRKIMRELTIESAKQTTVVRKAAFA